MLSVHQWRVMRLILPESLVQLGRNHSNSATVKKTVNRCQLPCCHDRPLATEDSTGVSIPEAVVVGRIR